MTLYDRIGVGYDTTRRADPGIVSRLLALLDVPDGSRCLDVACGTGNYTAALQEAGLQMTGLDVSWQMLNSARAKPTAVNWVNGDAATLPFADATFDGAVCTMALHHFRQPERTFREIARVLGHGRQKRRVVFFTAARDQMRRYWLNEYFPDAMAKAIRQMPPVEQSLAELTAAGFAHVIHEPWSVTPDVQDLFIYAAKYRPALYLDPRVRAGISTFANLADPSEVEQGCARLSADLASGHFVEVLRASEDDGQGGDYLFLVAST